MKKYTTKKVTTKRKIQHHKKKKLKSKKLIGGNDTDNKVGYNTSGIKYTNGDYLYSTTTLSKIYKLEGYKKSDNGYISEYDIRCLTDACFKKCSQKQCEQRCASAGSDYVGCIDKCLNENCNVQRVQSPIGIHHKKAEIIGTYENYIVGNPINYENKQYTIGGFLNTKDGITTHCILNSVNESNPFSTEKPLQELIIPVDKLPNTEIPPMGPPNPEIPSFHLSNILNKFGHFCFDFDDTIAHKNNYNNHLSLEPSIIRSNRQIVTTNSPGVRVNDPQSVLYNTDGDAFSQEELQLEGAIKDYFYDPDNLVKLMIYLTINEKLIYIMSYGDPRIITALLNKLIDDYFDRNEFDKDKTITFNNKKIKIKPEFTKGVNVFGIFNAFAVDEKGAQMKMYIPRDYNGKYKFITDAKIPDKSKIIFFDDDYNNTIAMNKFGISAITIPGNKTDQIKSETTFDHGFNISILETLNSEINYIDMVKQDYLFSRFDENEQVKLQRNNNQHKLNELIPKYKEGTIISLEKGKHKYTQHSYLKNNTNTKIKVVKVDRTYYYIITEVTADGMCYFNFIDPNSDKSPIKSHLSLFDLDKLFKKVDINDFFVTEQGNIVSFKNLYNNEEYRIGDIIFDVSNNKYKITNFDSENLTVELDEIPKSIFRKVKHHTSSVFILGNTLIKNNTNQTKKRGVFRSFFNRLKTHKTTQALNVAPPMVEQQQPPPQLPPRLQKKQLRVAENNYAEVNYN